MTKNNKLSQILIEAFNRGVEKGKQIKEKELLEEAEKLEANNSNFDYDLEDLPIIDVDRD